MSVDLREVQIQKFLHASGWGDAQCRALAVDASTRRYYRLAGPKGNAVLMDAPLGLEAVACPPAATPDERAAMGYNALARLAGPNTRAFAALASELNARGFSAPQILATEHDLGFLILEDLGDALFANLASDKSVNEMILYSAAIDTLAALSRSCFDATMPSGGDDWTVLEYDPHALLSETNLLLDWYAPFRGAAPDDAARQALQGVWRKAFTVLDNLPKVLVLRDVHAENLIWLPMREGAAKTGLLDFQDAVFGSPAYDLVSLLQDSRRDLPQGLEAKMLMRFLKHSKISDQDAFAASYAIVGAQRAAKVLGIFVRLAQRDHKPRYLDFLPRTAGNLVRSLEHPALAELKILMQTHMPAIFEEGAL